MKLVSYSKDEQDQLAILVDNLLYDTDLLHPDLPVSMAMFLNYWEDFYAATAAINKKLEEGAISSKQAIDFADVDILPPVPLATSHRSAYAFAQHPASLTSRLFRPYPSFYFANHHCFQGPGEVVCLPDHLLKSDFELSVAIVICKAGKNIKAAEADDYVGGYMIMNNISSRHFITGDSITDLFAGNNKSFATPLGPALVTTGALEAYKVDCKPGHTGSAYDLAMTCSVNGVLISEANMADMEWTFAEIIEQASYGVQLYPGDIISSGAAGGGCFLALNAMGKYNDAAYTERWLQEGDVIELVVEELGTLRNAIVKDESDFSLLADIAVS